MPTSSKPKTINKKYTKTKHNN